MKIDMVIAITPEIATAELNTLREDLNIIIPADFMVKQVGPLDDGSTLVRIEKRDDHEGTTPAPDTAGLQ